MARPASWLDVSWGSPYRALGGAGWNDVSWHKEGGNIIKTPKLQARDSPRAKTAPSQGTVLTRGPCAQALADGGTTLSNYYVYRFCSPTRSTFMTGRFGTPVAPTIRTHWH